MATNAPDGLTPAQEQALVCLLNEPTVKAAAEKAGVGERTLHRWLDEPAFDREFKKGRRKMFAQAIGLSQKYASLAINFLGRTITNEAAPYPSRVQAALGMLKFSRESIELDEMAGRLEALEASEKERKP